jgi:hypothetical protein
MAILAKPTDWWKIITDGKCLICKKRLTRNEIVCSSKCNKKLNDKLAASFNFEDK